MNDRLTDDMLFDFYSYMQNSNDSKDDEGYYSSGIHCSSLGMCKRKVVMEYYKFDRQEHNLPTLLMFDIGNHVHRVVQKWMSKSDRFELIYEEFNVTDGLPKPFSGKLDMLFRDKVSDEVVLADIKTAMPLMFKQYMSSLPKENHIIQLSAYARGLDNLGIKYDKLAMMYFDRAGSNKPLIYFVEPYKDIDKLMDEYILAQLRYEQDKILPERLDALFNKESAWECSYCNFNNISCEGLIGKVEKKGKK